MEKLEVTLVFLMVVGLARFLMWHWCAWKGVLTLSRSQEFAADHPIAYRGLMIVDNDQKLIHDRPEVYEELIVAMEALGWDA
jgi:hypothetical protein